MSANAISGIIVIRALLQIGNPSWIVVVLAGIWVLIATIRSCIELLDNAEAVPPYVEYVRICADAGDWRTEVQVRNNLADIYRLLAESMRHFSN